MSVKTGRQKSLLAMGLAVLALAAPGLTGRAAASAARGRVPLAAPSVPTPLATSTRTSEGTWATLPMGRLDEPLNTFWQLLMEPAGKAAWSNQVEATATATNGGLVLAAAGPSLTVGVRPSVDLTFTPLISTSDAARSWSDGLITEALAARPGALATGRGGRALALVDGRGGAEVLATEGDISTWRALAAEHTLAAGPPGQDCSLGALTAVGYLAGRALVGGSCAHPGVVGIFAQRGGSWNLVGPTLPQPLRGGHVEVLSLGQVGTGAYALLAVVNSNVTDLVAAWSGRDSTWATSPALVLGHGEQVGSYGPAASSGVFVLLQAPSGRETLAVAGGPAEAWADLPSPPPGTATVAFGAAGPAHAFVARGTGLTIWSLGPGARRWAVGQVMHVPLQYGSSS